MGLASLNALRVLVVDDEQLNLELLSEILCVCGCSKVVCESDPVHALEQYGKAEFDLVLLDVHMPGMSGLEFMARAKKNSTIQQPIFIFLTGCPTEEIHQTARLLGAHRVISKPYATSEIVNIVENL